MTDHNNRWPNEEERKERRAILHSKLDDFLDRYVDNPNGGWAEATDEDIKEIDDIFEEISALKFARDEDGDSVTRIRVSRRNGDHDLVSVYVPKMPDYDAEPEVIITYARNLISAKKIMESHFNNNYLDTALTLIRDGVTRT